MMSTKEMTQVLNAALEMEIEGRLFYLKCASGTKSGSGQAMFEFLAGEEAAHYDKVEKIYQAEFNKEYVEHRKNQAAKKDSGVFKDKVQGGKADKKADALDALNIGMKAEERSILLYTRLSGGAHNDKLKKFFKNLVKEEKNHRVILEKEIEAVTLTGTYTDFKVVTS